MSLGAWLLVIFSVLSFIYFYLWLPDRFDLVELLRKIPHSWDKLAIVRWFKKHPLLEKLHRKNLHGFRRLLGMVGIPVALLVGIYTGVLLGTVTARPFWNNPMLPMLFLVSALKTGTASICLIGFFFKGFHGMNGEQIAKNKFFIHAVDFYLMILSIIAILLYIFGLYSSPGSSQDAAGQIMGGEFTFLFWGIAVVVGLVLPLSLEVYELIPYFVSHAARREHNPWISGAVSVSVLAGGFILRYVVVYAGQMAKIITT
jgi:formate-dependent nitrite reductase membrane component NrfD